MESTEQLLKKANLALLENRTEEAEKILEQATAADDSSYIAHFFLARIALSRNNKSKALACFKKATAETCNIPEIFFEYGNMLYNLGKYFDAEKQYKKALDLNLHSTPLLTAYGTVLNILGKNKEAEKICRQMIKSNDNKFESYTLLGNILRDQGKTREAVNYYRQALAIKPDYMIAFSNLLLCLNYDEYDPEIILKEHKKWAEKICKDIAGSNIQKISYNNRKLRIGYVSPDFRTHSVAYFMEAILKNHNKSKFEVFCYSDVANPDPVTLRFMEQASHWRETENISNEELYNSIKKDKIDILIDLAGHMGNLRLPVFCRRPAPLQITYLGYPNTTGLSGMDYRLTDSLADPEGEDIFYTEKLYRMPHGFLCYTPPANAPRVASETPAARTGKIVFGSFNNPAKISEATVETWAEVLRTVSDSNLILKAKAFISPDTRERYREMFVERGIDAGRIKCMEPSPTLEVHLSVYNSIDIALDTYPYNGTTTTCEALWMGVPVITLTGSRHRSRVGYSILSRAGLSGMAAFSKEKFVKLSLFLSEDINRLTKLRRGLRNALANSLLCDGKSFTNDLENAFINMIK